MFGRAGLKVPPMEPCACVGARAGDEAGGDLREGPARGPDRGDQGTGGGGTVRHQCQDGVQDAAVLGATWVRSHEAAVPAQAGRVRWDHRCDPGGGQGAAEEAASHSQAHFRAATRRARLHGQGHDREGLRIGLSSAVAGDVRAAPASPGPCSGGLRRGHRRDRRRRAQDPFFGDGSTALRRDIRGGLPSRDDGSVLRRPCQSLRVLRRRSAVDPL